MTKKKSCGGACCRRFILPYSPDELKEQYRAWLVGSRSGRGVTVLTKRGNSPHGKLGFARGYQEEVITVDPEIYLLYPMLTYLGYCDFEPCRPRKKIKEKTHQYTCKHFDRKSALCTIYEDRPFMCRRYPNGDACLFPSCKLPGNKKKMQEQQKKSRKYAVLKDEVTVEEG